MIKQHTTNTDFYQETMAVGDSTSDPLSDWLEDSISYLPSFFESPTTFLDDLWWLPPDHELHHHQHQQLCCSAILPDIPTCTDTAAPPVDHGVASHHPDRKVPDPLKKRKAPKDLDLVRKRGHCKSTKDGSGNASKRSGRWAEQLLRPCAAAVTAGNVTRVRHLLFVLRELASPTGDANYRLAFHGLQALTHHLSSATLKAAAPAVGFSTAKPRFFQQSLINFNDINPWFTVPNNIANSSILQVLSEHDPGSCRSLHILDIGVSHGLQWPTLLEALSRRTGGPPPLVTLTVVPPTLENHQVPFANSPPGYDFVSNILRFASEYKINLHINRLDNCPLQDLGSQVIKPSPDETFIVCAQFRLHNLNHMNPDNRTEFLKLLRSLDPTGVVLSDNNLDCSCNSCGNFETGFTAKVESLWSFLDSTSVAFKGREMEERKLMEGEASKALINTSEMNERKEKWGDRMRAAGFAGDVFREDVMDGARALLRKYDNNWELKVEEGDNCVGLWWKGQPVSFCSLWKTDAKTPDRF